jgi:hypothetical protein
MAGVDKANAIAVEARSTAREMREAISFNLPVGTLFARRIV